MCTPAQGWGEGPAGYKFPRQRGRRRQWEGPEGSAAERSLPGTPHPSLPCAKTQQYVSQVTARNVAGERTERRRSAKFGRPATLQGAEWPFSVAGERKNADLRHFAPGPATLQGAGWLFSVAGECMERRRSAKFGRPARLQVTGWPFSVAGDGKNADLRHFTAGPATVGV